MYEWPPFFEPRFVRVTPDVILRLLFLDLWNAIAFAARQVLLLLLVFAAEILISPFHN